MVAKCVDPIIIAPTMQRYSSDCATCCLAMLIGVDYTAVTAAISRRSKIAKDGLTTREMRAVARRLGVELRFRFTPPEDEEIGILSLEKPTDNDGHVAMFLYGSVYDSSSGLLYTDLGAYLLATGWEVVGFLWRES